MLKQTLTVLSKGEMASKPDLRAFMLERGAPKTVDQCQNQITKLQERISKDDMKAKCREENKSVALGTSKINYMDPRITIGWCKAKELPIEKIFQSTLRAKFAWAMDTELAWKF